MSCCSAPPTTPRSQTGALPARLPPRLPLPILCQAPASQFLVLAASCQAVDTPCAACARIPAGWARWWQRPASQQWPASRWTAWECSCGCLSLQLAAPMPAAARREPLRACRPWRQRPGPCPAHPISSRQNVSFSEIFVCGHDAATAAFSSQSMQPQRISPETLHFIPSLLAAQQMPAVPPFPSIPRRIVSPSSSPCARPLRLAWSVGPPSLKLHSLSSPPCHPSVPFARETLHCLAHRQCAPSLPLRGGPCGAPATVLWSAPTLALLAHPCTPLPFSGSPSRHPTTNLA